MNLFSSIEMMMMNGLNNKKSTRFDFEKLILRNLAKCKERTRTGAYRKKVDELINFHFKGKHLNRNS